MTRANTLPPDPKLDLTFTRVALEPSGKGTKYTATVVHGDEASARKHEAIGFHEGWGKALNQLVEYVNKSSEG